MPTKILVVDDEPDLELLIAQKFRKRVRDNELVFAFAENGVDALKKMREDSEIDVVLTDINMPEMDGLTLLAKITEHHPLVKSVIVSAYGDMANIRTALNRGAFDFVTKPIDFDDLEATLNKTIQEARARKQAAKTYDQLVALQQELEVAQRIQESLVPRQFPPFPERRDFELHAEMIPAKEVGGDLYDFFMLDDARLGFVIGDVSGKGVPSALFMAVSKTLLKAVALKGLPPGECLQQVNRILYLESVASMFVSMLYGILDARTGEVTCSNGGHHAPLILRADGRVEEAQTSGSLALGAREKTDYESKHFALQPGETILLYTDGVTEAMNPDGEEFTETGLRACMQQQQNAPLQEIVAHVIAEVEKFSGEALQADDMTILALRYLG